MAKPLYKILAAREWSTARGHIPWADVDRRDGFVHLSAEHQVRETAAKHFAGQTGLVLLEVESEGLEGLRWEASRGGSLFPHVYADIPLTAVTAVRPLPWTDAGFDFGDGL